MIGKTSNGCEGTYFTSDDTGEVILLTEVEETEDQGEYLCRDSDGRTWLLEDAEDYAKLSPR